MRKFPPLNLFTDVQLQRVYLICLAFDIVCTSYRLKKEREGGRERKERNKGKKKEKKKIKKEDPEHFLSNFVLRLSTVTHRLGFPEEFSLILETSLLPSSASHVVGNHWTLAPESFKVCGVAGWCNSSDLFCFPLKFPGPILAACTRYALRCVFLYAVQMKILRFLFLWEKLLTVKGWMQPSTGVKAYVSQHRVKIEKSSKEKIRGVSSSFNLDVLPKLFSP